MSRTFRSKRMTRFPANTIDGYIYIRLDCVYGIQPIDDKTCNIYVDGGHKFVVGATADQIMTELEVTREWLPISHR